ncbi:aldehyde dehydrogenase [Mesoflavibacter sp. SCSIO 43206]|uniref:aldehyde dehydrogenase n=1 Tax=Mesoflavibacter sp. SCSIO 43206 TaxID=2779362 RepID=UPI001CA9762A|nr:aldehyde dehydrogenase [Mesoflavibacter sp. SCSIO 43206]UAB75311.1 aldehyde dehydrogenase [Mesoflavibacter sp. SCSIO 43206]
MIEAIVNSQKDFFKTGKTKTIAYRKQLLKQLQSELIKQEDLIVKTLYDDFKKPEFESVITETAIVLQDLKRTINNINKWAKPKRVFPSLLNFPSSDYLYSEPYGTVLIIAPWNYPYQLALAPLIGAVAAGNTVVLKPSELTPNTSALLTKIIKHVFPPEFVTVVEGGVDTSTQLLNQVWDYIFFTGSVGVGKIVAKAAAPNLTPITLELGGKNPCIVDKTANIKLTVKRIVWGKFINAGQTCIAPDYILIDASIKNKFYEVLKDELITIYTKNPEKSSDFARIINKKNFNRLSEMLTNENCIIGGQTNAEDLYISPTIIDEPSLNSKVMEDEIFGPILPVISFKNLNEVHKIINRYPKPLSLYVFSTNTTQAKKLIKEFSFGGGCINDTVVHFANHKLPFGGVGNSGIGAYHGKYTFDTFSHKKAIVKKANWLDIPLRYAPYSGKLKKLKSLLKWL